MKPRRSVVVVGSGPNGLVAAVMLARAGFDVTVLEAADRAGGGLRTESLTLPGFAHDVCSAVHPLAVVSPAMASLRLEQYGLRWLHHDVVATHPLDGGHGAVLCRDVRRTAAGLGTDAGPYLRLMDRFVRDWPTLRSGVLGPPSAWFESPGNGALPAAVLRTAARWTLPADTAARWWFSGAQARALLAGCAAHSFLPLHRLGTAGFGALLLTLAHTSGWPVAQGGSRAIADALVDALADAGGRIELSRPVRDLAELAAPAAGPRPGGPRPVVVLNLTAANALRLLRGSASRVEAGDGAGDAAPAERARRRLAALRPGGGVWKIDYALDAPLRWEHEPSRSAGTVHLGGTLEETAAAARALAAGVPAAEPFTLVAQPTLVDPSRAPAGKHVAWVYAHVPHGHGSGSGAGPGSGAGSGSGAEPGGTAGADSTAGTAATAAVERQIERFAPGFGRSVLARSVMGTAEMAAHNANCSGGDITGGRLDLAGLLHRARPLACPYRIGTDLYLCSASTPPGPGAHGMAGWHAARAVVRDTSRG
ncbi:MAG TPA: hypothetical protein DEP69_02235 [Acidimicrobiaceae bacterium]|nr:hypothetical protein [Acidimicrobiaceae bacterium]